MAQEPGADLHCRNCGLFGDYQHERAPDSSSAQKPLVYDLLYQLNAAFARVHHKMAALTAVGIFDPLIMRMLNCQFETLRAGSNSQLLGAMRRIEERDRERFSQPPNELNP